MRNFSGSASSASFTSLESVLSMSSASGSGEADPGLLSRMWRYRIDSSTSSSSVVSGRAALRRYWLMKVFVRIRNSHALRLVPGVNWSRWRNALM